jgi:hypothetical protein
MDEEGAIDAPHGADPGEQARPPSPAAEMEEDPPAAVQPPPELLQVPIDASLLTTRANLGGNDAALLGAVRSLDRTLHVRSRQTGANPINEFGNNEFLLAGGFPHCFPLGVVCPKKGGITPKVISHMLSQWHRNMSSDYRLVLLLADQQRRHIAAQSVSLRVHNRPEAANALGALMNNAAFRAEVERAAQPDSPNATEPERRAMQSLRMRLLARVHGILSVAARKIPYSPLQRANAMSELYSMVSSYGPPALFVTISMDDTYDDKLIRLSIKVNDQKGFPVVDDGLFAALQNHMAVFHEIDISPSGLSKLAAGDPVAAAHVFKFIVHTFITELVRASPPNGRKAVFLSDLKPGIFGYCPAYYLVDETQGRGTLHMHGLFITLLNPHIIQHSVGRNDLFERVGAALSNLSQCHISPLLHLDSLVRNSVAFNRWRGGNQPVRERASLFPDWGDFAIPCPPAWITQAGERAMCLTNLHQHTATCRKGKSGAYGCRMSFPRATVEEIVARNLQVRLVEDERAAAAGGAAGGAVGAVAGGAAGGAAGQQSPPRLPALKRKRAVFAMDGPDPSDPLSEPTENDPVPAGDTRNLVVELARPEIPLMDEMRRVAEAVLIERPAEDALLQERARYWTDVLRASDSVPDFLKADAAHVRLSNMAQVLASLDSDGREDEELHEISKRIAAIIRGRNGRVVETNKYLAALFGSNTNVSVLGATSQVKSALQYLVKYCSKDAAPLAQSLSVLHAAVEKHLKHGSVAPDAGTDTRTAKYCLQVMINKSHSMAELAAPAAAAAVLGYKAETTNLRFTFLFLYQALTFLLRKNASFRADQLRRRDEMANRGTPLDELPVVPLPDTQSTHPLPQAIGSPAGAAHNQLLSPQSAASSLTGPASQFSQPRGVVLPFTASEASNVSAAVDEATAVDDGQEDLDDVASVGDFDAVAGILSNASLSTLTENSPVNLHAAAAAAPAREDDASAASDPFMFVLGNIPGLFVENAHGLGQNDDDGDEDDDDTGGSGTLPLWTVGDRKIALGMHDIYFNRPPELRTPTWNYWTFCQMISIEKSDALLRQRRGRRRRNARRAAEHAAAAEEMDGDEGNGGEEDEQQGGEDGDEGEGADAANSEDENEEPAGNDDARQRAGRTANARLDFPAEFALHGFYQCRIRSQPLTPLLAGRRAFSAFSWPGPRPANPSDVWKKKALQYARSVLILFRPWGGNEPHSRLSWGALCRFVQSLHARVRTSDWACHVLSLIRNFTHGLRVRESDAWAQMNYRGRAATKWFHRGQDNAAADPDAPRPGLNGDPQRGEEDSLFGEDSGGWEGREGAHPHRFEQGLALYAAMREANQGAVADHHVQAATLLMRQARDRAFADQLRALYPTQQPQILMDGRDYSISDDGQLSLVHEDGSRHQPNPAAALPDLARVYVREADQREAASNLIRNLRTANPAEPDQIPAAALNEEEAEEQQEHENAIREFQQNLANQRELSQDDGLDEIQREARVTELLRSLNAGQAAIANRILQFASAAAAVDRANQAIANNQQYQQLPDPPLLLVHGGPGTGKTHLMVTIDRCLQLRQLPELVCTAPTGNAASLLPRGSTLHSLLGISSRKTSNHLGTRQGVLMETIGTFRIF